MPARTALLAPERILDAAEAGFARAGFAATSIKTIGHDAGLNPALLYYYFGDKEGLYHAVLRRRMEALGGMLGAALDPALPPEEAVAQVVRGYASFLRQHPALPRLMLREIIDHDAAHALAELRAGAGAMLRGIVSLVVRGQAQGVFRRDLDPVNIVVSMMGQVVYAFLAQPLIQGVLLEGRSRRSDAWLQQFGEHAVAFVLAALRPPAPDTAKPARRRARAVALRSRR